MTSQYLCSASLCFCCFHEPWVFPVILESLNSCFSQTPVRCAPFLTPPVRSWGCAELFLEDNFHLVPCRLIGAISAPQSWGHWPESFTREDRCHFLFPRLTLHTWPQPASCSAPCAWSCFSRKDGPRVWRFGFDLILLCSNSLSPGQAFLRGLPGLGARSYT